MLLLPRVSYRRLPLTFLPSHRDSHGRPFRYSFVSWRLPSCLSTILLPLRIPLLLSLSRRSSFAFSGRTFRALVCVFLFSPSEPYIRHSCGIAPSLDIVLQPCSAFVGRCGPPKEVRLTFLHEGGHFKGIPSNVCTGKIPFQIFHRKTFSHLLRGFLNSEADTS